MPNIPLFPRQNVRIAELANDVPGFYETALSFEAHVGTEPLEDGSNVNDHAVANRFTLSLRGVLSDLSTQTTPVKDAIARIDELFRNATPVTVTTPLQDFPEMIIARFHARQQGRGVEFDMTLIKVIRVGVTMASVSTPTTGGPAENRKSAAERGRVNSPVAPDPVSTPTPVSAPA